MAIYFFDKNQTLIKIVPESATFEAIQTQELDDDSLLKDTLSVTVKGDEKLIGAEYMAVKSYKGNAQTFDMYRILTDTTPDKSMSFTGMSLAPYELNGHILQDLRPANHSLSYTLNRVLDGTDWRVGYIEDGLSNVTTTFYYVSAKEALKELQSLVSCEFVFKVEISGQKITDKWIEVYSEMGNRTKKRFNYGTNALTVVRETNKADIFTALIGRGKGEEVSSADDNESGQAGYGRKITFEDIEWKKSSGKPLDKPKGQYYLELPQATQAYGIKNIDGTMKARVGIVDFDDEEDKNRLINLTYQQLLVSSRPKVLFKTTVANIGATGIGDTVTIHRHDLNIHYQTRVRKIVRNKLNDNKTQIELGDAVVTASTKQTKQNNATIKNLNNEIDKIKANVTTSQNSADGKNTIFYGSAEPERQRTGDTWYRPHPSIAGETQMLTWNGTAWELVLDTSDLTSVSRAVEDASRIAGEAVQAAQDADVRANEAIKKAGANANLLTTHQSTLDTIKNTAIPNINSSISDAMAEAKSALSSASSAMDEAKKADGKIANYVTTKGLVSGTTVDSKIDTATGEISKKITTVESKIPTEIGGRNYWALAKKPWFSYLTHLGNGVFTNTSTGLAFAFMTMSKLGVDVGEDYTLSFEIKVSDNSIQFSNNQMYVNSLISIVTHNKPTLIKDKWVKVFSTFNYSEENTTHAHIYFSSNLPSNNSIEFRNFKLEKGNIVTDWSPAPEDNYTQHDFQIFENTYSEDVKGINSTLTELSNKKVDGTTYQDFYNNEYKKTAKGVTDTYNKVNKIIDANGNSTDAFAKAVYDRNATRQSASFNKVTKDLVKTATYTAGINGVKDSITSVRGDLDKLSVGSRNLIEYSMIETTGGTSDKSEYLTKGLITYSGYSITGGLRINASKLEPNTDYVMSYKYQKTSGELKYFGGHTDVAFSNNTVYVDGADSGVGYTSYKSVYVGDDTKIHSVVVKFTTPDTVTPTNLIYIQPNRTITATVSVNIFDWKMEKGTIPTDWSPAPEDMLGKEDFQVFKGTYESNDQAIKSRLTAIDSGKEGSVVTRLNKTESTASGNSTLISTINKNYVKQSNIDASILADKKIKDTRNTNQLPSWYFSNYPSQEVREFKLVSTMGIGSGTYGILTTNVPWAEKSGGTVKQTFETNAGIHTRQGNSAGTAWGAWVKQIDTADTTYQKVVETSNLYERVLGSTNEAGVKSNISRIIQTSEIIQQTVTSAMNVENRNLLITKNATNDSWLTGGETYPKPTSQPNRGTSTSPDLIEVKSGDKFTLSKNETTLFFRVSFLNSSKGYISRYVQNAKLGTITPPSGTAYMWVSYPTNADAKVEKGSIATGYSPAPEDTATQSHITQLADNINLKVSKGDLISQINVQAGGVLITSGTNKLNVTPTTTYIENGTIKSAMIASLEADKITTGTLDAGKVKVINIDADNITGNLTDFIQSNWNQATGGGVTITGGGVRAINSEGSRVTLENGVVSVGNRAGVNLGFFGDHILNKSSTGTMTITASHGTETAFISATSTDGKTYKRSMSIMSGGAEIDMFTTLNMNKNSLKDVTNIGFTGGLIKGNISGSARYMTIEAGTGTAFDVSGVTRMSVTSVVNIFSGIDMKGNDIASVGKLTYNSDQRLKTNIKDTNIRALDAIRNWQLVSYDWLESGEHIEIGLIAQNSPEVMTYNDESDIYGIDAGKQTMINTLAIQQLDSKTDDKVEQLEAKIASLQEELAQLKGD